MRFWTLSSRISLRSKLALWASVWVMSRGARANRSAFFPGRTAEAPQSHTRTPGEGSRNQEIGQRFERCQLNIGEIPVGEAPHKLPVEPNGNQQEKHQGGHGNRTDSHAVKQDDTPVVNRPRGGLRSR